MDGAPRTKNSNPLDNLVPAAVFSFVTFFLISRAHFSNPTFLKCNIKKASQEFWDPISGSWHAIQFVYVDSLRQKTDPDSGRGPFLHKIIESKRSYG